MTSEQLARNDILTVLSRFAMIVATAALPVLGWLLTRSVHTVDEISAKVDSLSDRSIETNSNVKLIQQTQQMQGAALQDHESRVRVLEGRPKLPSAPP